MLSKILSKSECASCKFCCSFRRKSLWETPIFTKTEVEKIQNNREEYCMLAAEKFNTICVLKGHNTVVSDGNDVYINKTGNSSLAKAGSGDVLTGVISGFAAQGYTLFQSAVLGVYLHGLCGEIASQDLTEYSVLASDLLKYIPFGIKNLM